MTTTTVSRPLEQNLEILRVSGRDNLADLIEQLPEGRRARAAAAAVRIEAPVQDAILGASDDELPATVRQILAGENR